MDEPELLAHRDGVVLRLTINRPVRRNAINQAVIQGIATQLRASKHDRDLRAIVLSGAGDKAFCAGADLATDRAFRFDYAEPRLPMPELFRLARAADVPIIGRINGICVGGGMGLLASCDLAVAVEDARFALPEAKVGVFPMQVLAVLQRVVPRRRLLELCLTGEAVSAGVALEMGLVNRVVPREALDEAVETLLHQITAVSPTSVRRGKYAAYAIEAMSFEESLAFMEGQIGLLAATEDAAEGIAAFREKRKPVWKGR